MAKTVHNLVVSFEVASSARIACLVLLHVLSHVLADCSSLPDSAKNIVHKGGQSFGDENCAVNQILEGEGKEEHHISTLTSNVRDASSTPAFKSHSSLFFGRPAQLCSAKSCVTGPRAGSRRGPLFPTATMKVTRG
mmetsp:Transcript_44601/g.95861  ORF Transcript_44601/g.95861 Transcript_44601/m.95861 type:complete len:136 (+) Transcript_44601:149-556(+)